LLAPRLQRVDLCWRPAYSGWIFAGAGADSQYKAGIVGAVRETPFPVRACPARLGDVPKEGAASGAPTTFLPA